MDSCDPAAVGIDAAAVSEKETSFGLKLLLLLPALVAVGLAACTAPFGELNLQIWQATRQHTARNAKSVRGSASEANERWVYEMSASLVPPGRTRAGVALVFTAITRAVRVRREVALGGEGGQEDGEGSHGWWHTIAKR
jgi:hypothetical protein